MNDQITTKISTGYDTNRRQFLQLTAAMGGIGLLLSACTKTNSSGIKLGSGDTGILNFALALEQLEAAFYTEVVANYGSFFAVDEISLLTDVRDHEIAHRGFLEKAIGSSAIGNLTFDFSTIDFTSRGGILNAAKAFEDLGVAAYNGAGPLISSPDYLAVAGKIVSVEARHAAYVRDLINFGSFADSTSVDTEGLDGSMAPPAVLALAGKYIVNKIDASQLP